MNSFKLENPLPYGLDERLHPSDFWETPGSVTGKLLEDYPPLKGLRIMDPCAGNGAILRVCLSHGYSVEAVDIREEARAELVKLDCPVVIGDWLKLAYNTKYQTIITNPPFSLACEITAASLGTGAQYVAMLLRLNVLGSNPWANLWIKEPPTAIRPLRKRPSFSGDGKTDACNYAWFIWDRSCEPLNIRPI